jgi:hypothetical protein
MRRTLCALALAAFAFTANAFNNTPETRFLLDQMAAKASKVRFEASEMAGHLKKRDANLALVEVRMGLLDQNAEELKKLLAEYEANATPASPELLSKLREAVAAINLAVDRKQELLFGPSAEKHRKTIRSQAQETVELSQTVRQLTTRLAE